MIKKIIQIGNSWGIILPKAVMELLKLNPVKDKLEFTIEGEKLVITKSKQS